ncbi:MAG: hypothetical protein HF978_12860 [Desulfobacteraceae bacterium]|nr:hypothetical protein [Desulfobacteraceae bacterium]MBC2756430.1 hypothetical protein [Desulfobacteraceae bacterium]MBC2763560.1 hypothetical protein [ANME-2 cluster archaeon]
MKPLDDNKLKQKLIDAYWSDPEIDINPVWQQNMMRKIRGIGPLKQDISTGLSFQELVWKIAPALCLLLVILITGMFSMDLSFETLINESFIDDPVVIIYNGIFWG